MRRPSRDLEEDLVLELLQLVLVDLVLQFLQDKIEALALQLLC